MTKQTTSALILAVAFALGIAAPIRADVITLPTADMNSNDGVGDYYYDSDDSYDFISAFPTPGVVTTVGSFSYTAPVGEVITGLSISGAFGNEDGVQTALSEYYLGYGGNETAFEVASCESTTASCYSSTTGPTPWGPVTLTGSVLTDAISALEAGSLDFSYTWDTNTADETAEAAQDDSQYVYLGDPTITVDLAATPEPATVLICLGGLAGIVALRRFRKA